MEKVKSGFETGPVASLLKKLSATLQLMDNIFGLAVFIC